MTIDVDNPRRLEFIGNGSDVAFPYDYRIFEETDLNVIVNGITQIVNADYTVTGVNAQGGGNVLFVIAPADMSEIIVDSDVPPLQTVDFEVGGKFKPDTVNFVNDKLTVIDQQVITLIKQRGLLYPESSFLDQNGKDNALPVMPAQINNEIPIWSKDKNNNLIGTILEEAGDLSNLRAELASETEPSPGAALIGYFDENDPIGPTGKTLDALLKAIAPLIDNRIAVVNEADATKKAKFDLSGLDPNTTAVIELHNTSGGVIPPGGIIMWSTLTFPAGYLHCDGSNIDLKSDIAPSFAENLFNAIGIENGMGRQIFNEISPVPAGATFQFKSNAVGSTLAHDAGATGFNIVVTTPGNSNTFEIIDITVVAANVIPPGSFMTLYNANGDRPNIFWYSVDGAGSPPSVPGSLINEVSLLSSDTVDTVVLKTIAAKIMQFKIPDYRGMFLRGYTPGGLKIINSINQVNGGSGYTVGDILTFSGGGIIVPGFIEVTAVGGGGVISVVEALSFGRYTSDFINPDFPTGGTGTGAQFNVGLEDIDPTAPERRVWSSTPGIDGETDQVVGAVLNTWESRDIDLTPQLFKDLDVSVVYIIKT